MKSTPNACAVRHSVPTFSIVFPFSIPIPKNPRATSLAVRREIAVPFSTGDEHHDDVSTTALRIHGLRYIQGLAPCLEPLLPGELIEPPQFRRKVRLRHLPLFQQEEFQGFWNREAAPRGPGKDLVDSGHLRPAGPPGLSRPPAAPPASAGLAEAANKGRGRRLEAPLPA